MPPARDTFTIEENAAHSGAASTALRWIGVSVLSVMVFAGPLAAGSVTWWAWGGLWGLSALALFITAAVWVVEGKVSFTFAPVAAVAALLSLMALFQIAPLASRLAGLTGERTQEVYRTLTGLRPAQISLCPGMTLEAFFKTTMVLMAAVSILALARSRAMLFALGGAVAAAALVAAGAGIIQENPGTEKIYGLFDISQGSHGTPAMSAALDPSLSSGMAAVEKVTAGDATFFRQAVVVGDTFGPYANSNHFGGLAEMALPMVLALFLAVWETRGGWREEGGLTGTSEGQAALFMVFAMALAVAALVYSHSFGAAAGLAAGFATVAAAVTFTRRTGKAAVVTVALFAAVAVITVAVMRPAVFRLLPGLLANKLAGRWDIWGATAQAARDFPIVGSGLGSFSRVIPHYEQTEMRHLFAHNDYVQLAMEAGLVVTLAAGALVVWQMTLLVRGARGKADVYCAALATGALGSMAALAVHSFFDYNLHIPANALGVTALLCVGTVASGAERLDIETIHFPKRILMSGRGKAAATAVIILVLVATGSVPLAGVMRANLYKGRARRAIAALPGDMPAQAPAGLANALAAARRASAYAGLDAEAAYQVALLSAARSRYERDEVEVQTLSDAALVSSVTAARLAPAYTFNALTAVTLGASGNGVTEHWPMSSFYYKEAQARLLLDDGRDEEGFAWMREAVALAVGDWGGVSAEASGAARDLLRRVGSYERIASASPDTFGGHLLFGKGLAAAGVNSAAVEEYILAAGCAAVEGKDAGLTENKARELLETLVGERRREQAFSMCSAVLGRRSEWQALRLSYAEALIRAGRGGEAGGQIEIILSSDAADWLKKRALALGDYRETN